MQNIVIKERGEESIRRKNIGVEQELVEVIILVTEEEFTIIIT